MDLLVALNSGLPGMCTLHANSAREALVKMCTLPLLAGENISAAFVVPTVAASVDLVVHLRSDAGGQRRVREIVGVTGRVEGDTIETSDIFSMRDDRLTRADGFPPHADRFDAIGADLASLLRHRQDGDSDGRVQRRPWQPGAALQPNRARHVASHDPAQHGPAQHGPAQHGPAEHGPAQHGPAAYVPEPARLEPSIAAQPAGARTDQDG